jgi:hypothetical protein
MDHDDFIYFNKYNENKLIVTHGGDVVGEG